VLNRLIGRGKKTKTFAGNFVVVGGARAVGIANNKIYAPFTAGQEKNYEFSQRFASFAGQRKYQNGKGRI